MKTFKPIISVICAVYNRENYLNTALSSILTQSYDNFELIIVNDGSTDNSEDVIKSFADVRIKYFKLEHQGCWTTKNFGILQATGDYICFIDSDDYISKDFFYKGINGINENPGFDYYYPTLMSIVTNDNVITNSIWRYIDYQDKANLIKLFWERQIGGIPHAGSFIKRKVFDELGLYNHTFYNLSDTAYIISHATEINFCLLKELKTYYNRQHKEQTNINMTERNRTFSEILVDIINKYPTEYYLNKNYDKSSVEFLDIVIEKFMQLANQTDFKLNYLEKAEYFLRKKRDLF